MKKSFKGKDNQRAGPIALNENSCQNTRGEQKHDRARQKKTSASPDKLAKKTLRYNNSEEGISGKDSGSGGKIHGVREGAGGYKPPEDSPEKDRTKSLDSTRSFETSDGVKAYSKVSELLAVTVVKVIESIVAQRPEDILVTPEWICKLHKDIAGALFPDWAVRFRDINVQVGTLIPTPFYEVPIQSRLFCEDLKTRINNLRDDMNALAELLAWIDWRFAWIHPFRDFTGRIGRILLTAIFFKLRLPPIETASIELKEKEKYLTALRLGDTGDLTSLTDVWLNRVSKVLGK